MKLDDAYANGPHIPNAALFPPRWTADAAAFRQALGARAALGIPYGPSMRQAYDLFHSKGPAKGTVVFVHGGYWLKFERATWSHFAKGALERGWNVAMPEYDLCPAVSIDQITRQIAAALTSIAGCVEGPIALTGHSAGGHLVARMLAPGMLAPDISGRIRCVAPISPVADLRPLLETSMNADLQLNQTSAAAESPVLQSRRQTPVHIWVGAEERPVFLEQATALSDAWQVPQTIVPSKHHFDIIDALCDPQSDLVTYLTAH